jgi:surface antigen
MHVLKQTTTFITALALLAACSQDTAYNASRGGVTEGAGMSKADYGTAIGAIGGGIAGYQFGGGSGKAIATVAGTLLGGALGRSLGGSLDRGDMAYYNQTSQRALETGQPGQALPWSNPQTGNSGTVTPQAYYQTPNGQYCREYSQQINVGGKTESGYGKACRQPDGTWQIVSQ